MANTNIQSQPTSRQAPLVLAFRNLKGWLDDDPLKEDEPHIPLFNLPQELEHPQSGSQSVSTEIATCCESSRGRRRSPKTAIVATKASNSTSNKENVDPSQAKSIIPNDHQSYDAKNSAPWFASPPSSKPISEYDAIPAGIKDFHLPYSTCSSKNAESKLPLSSQKIDSAASSTSDSALSLYTRQDAEHKALMLQANQAQPEAKGGAISIDSISSPSSDEKSSSTVALDALIRARQCVQGWLTSIETVSSTRCLQMISSQSKADTSGLPLETLEPAQSLIPSYLEDIHTLAWRRANMTSEMHILHTINQQRCAFHKELFGRSPFTERIHDRMHGGQSTTNFVIRPVESHHINQIVNIMVSDSLSSHVVHDEKFTRISCEQLISNCKASQWPFIVAIETEGDLFDRSKWPTGADKVYEEFLQYKRSTVNKNEKVVGFAFLTNARIAFTGLSPIANRYCAQIRLVVDPSHRRAKIGSTLLSNILSCSSPRYRYENRASNSPRQCNQQLSALKIHNYTQLYIEFFGLDPKHSEVIWKEKMLERFGFQQAGRLLSTAPTNHAVILDKRLDVFLWQLIL